MYTDLVQTAILLTLLWIALSLWAISTVLYKVARIVRRPSRVLQVNRKDFDLPFIKYVVASVMVRYALRKLK